MRGRKGESLMVAINGDWQRVGTQDRSEMARNGNQMSRWPVELRHFSVTERCPDWCEMKRRGGVYVYRTRKPGAVFGMPTSFTLAVALLMTATLAFLGGPWPLAALLLACSGRHFAYVGETRSFAHRDRQHRSGDVRWGSHAKPWSDLDPKCYRLSMPGWKWLLRSVETLLIVLLWPVYNDKKNRWNPRRITMARARSMRYARDDVRAGGSLGNRLWGRLVTLRAPHAMFALLCLSAWMVW